MFSCLSATSIGLPHKHAKCVNPLLPKSTTFVAILIRIMTLGEPLGRVKMQLFSHTVPKTAENFRQLCTGEHKNQQGRPMGYKGSKFHRVVGRFYSLQEAAVERLM